MRRALALLLLVGFSFPLIAPLFASAPSEASLPACCRRNGKHHCAMGASVVVSSRYATVAAQCPYSPFAGLAFMLPHGFTGHAQLAAEVQAPGPAAIVRDAEAGYRISFDRSRQKRGPPLLLSL
ncbi:MAG TPA: hypothetical protein VIY53_21025 [Acidobacteriaceae bacterium]